MGGACHGHAIKLRRGMAGHDMHCGECVQQQVNPRVQPHRTRSPSAEQSKREAEGAGGMSDERSKSHDPAWARNNTPLAVRHCHAMHAMPCRAPRHAMPCATAMPCTPCHAVRHAMPCRAPRHTMPCATPCHAVRHAMPPTTSHAINPPSLHPSSIPPAACLHHEDGPAILMQVPPQLGEEHRPPPLHMIQIRRVIGAHAHRAPARHLPWAQRQAERGSWRASK